MEIEKDERKRRKSEELKWRVEGAVGMLQRDRGEKSRVPKVRQRGGREGAEAWRETEDVPGNLSQVREGHNQPFWSPHLSELAFPAGPAMEKWEPRSLDLSLIHISEPTRLS